MNTKPILILCVAALTVACSQKQRVVSVPVSTIDVEQLNEDIDYNMDVTGLSLGDLRLLRNAPAARQGFPFKDAYVRAIYETTTWYDSLMWKFDEQTNFENIEEKADESWRDYYYRASEETGLLTYTDEEQAFIKRLKEREDELRKHNFDVAEGLRVNVQNLANPRQLAEFDSLLCQQLARDGFAIVPAENEQLFHVYEQNDYNCFPSFVTTDLFLQLYHLYFDCMLREVEENALLPLMIRFTRDMHEVLYNIERWSGFDEEVNQIAHHNTVYYNIAYKLFTGDYISAPDAGGLDAEEVGKVMKGQNDLSRFMADYKDIEFAYSLFRPRGHYTRNEKLQRYFRGMMWLQSVPFGLDYKAEVQAAVMQACALKAGRSTLKDYERLNQLITYLMGQTDNLGLTQVLAEVEKTGMQMEDLIHDAQAIAKITAALNEAGDKQTRIRPKFENTSHNKVNVMPQRYQPDAEVLQEMVDYDNDPTLRPTPKGLDFFAAMGVTAAEQVLLNEQQAWKDFKPMLTKMKQRMGEINWQETIATQWMNTLKVLNRHDQQQQPYFMGTPEWSLKDLNAGLASWAELKHDAILYAKQPMGAECGGGGVPDPVTKGYVEPNVGFWKKAIELLTNTHQLLEQQNMLTSKVAETTDRIREEAEFLLAVSEKELSGKPLTDEEYDQLKCIGATFENISLDLVRQPNQYLMGWDDVEGADRKVALVADVYTANAKNNPNKSILYEAVGHADDIYVIVEIDGYLYLTRGAVLSYREFTEPLGSQRLTDEEWQEQLQKNPRKGVPDWMQPITIPLKNKPIINEEIFYSSGC